MCPVSETANFLHLTSTTITLSADPAVFDQPVTTATVSNGTGRPPSGGTGTFKAGSVTLGVGEPRDHHYRAGLLDNRRHSIRQPWRPSSKERPPAQ